jgi:hypothetical protein
MGFTIAMTVPYASCEGMVASQTSGARLVRGSDTGSDGPLSNKESSRQDEYT